MENINWTTIILTLGTAVITASATLFASWIAQRGQRRIKELEIKGQSGLKAKEILFQTYQKRIERQEQNLLQLQNWLKELSEHFDKSEKSSEEKNRELFIALSALFETVKEPSLENIQEVENDLRELEIYEKRKKDLEFIKSFFNFNVKDLKQENLTGFYLQFMKVLGLTGSIKDEILNKKCEVLFTEYLPKKSLELEIK